MRLPLIFLVLFSLALACCAKTGGRFEELDFPDLKINLFIARVANDGFEFQSTLKPSLEKDGSHTVTGRGIVRYGKHVIEVKEWELIVDGHRLEMIEGRIQNFVVGSRGEIQPGFVRNFD